MDRGLQIECSLIYICTRLDEKHGLLCWKPAVTAVPT